MQNQGPHEGANSNRRMTSDDAYETSIEERDAVSLLLNYSADSDEGYEAEAQTQ